MITTDDDLEVELFGSFRRLQPESPPQDRQDLYSLFTSRAASLGWSGSVDPARSGRPLWGMANAGDAIESDGEAGGSGPMAWFHVVPLTDPARGEPLPLQALIKCATDTVDRLGLAQVARLRVGVPLWKHSVAASALLGGLNWYWESPAGERVNVCADITMDTTGIDSRPDRDLSTAISEWQITPFAVSKVPGEPPDTLGSRATERVHFTAPEWSPDAMGWIAAALVDNAYRLGYRRHAIITVARAAE